jgi:mono/diheme cytochrome c family protein
MKRLNIFLNFILLITLLYSCDNIKRTPGTIYMPDMAYSRAYETYASHSNLADSGINYNNIPVSGTIARNMELPFHISKDKVGDTTNYVLSKSVKSPIDTLNEKDLKESERLYLINCGICHGNKLDGNGPLYKGGEGPYPAKPATLVGDIKYENMPEGQMFYSVAYGKNLMGSYASQLSRKQRWMVIAYIKTRQHLSKVNTPSTVEVVAKK